MGASRRARDRARRRAEYARCPIRPINGHHGMSMHIKIDSTRHTVLRFACILLWSAPAFGQELQLPFEGVWFVMQGGDTINVNQHMASAAQAFAIDFAKVGGPSQRQLSTTAGPPTRIEDFYS